MKDKQNKDKSLLSNNTNKAQYKPLKHETCNVSKSILTVFLWIAFIEQAMLSNMTGPTILQLGYIFKRDISVMSFTFTFERIGFILGCLLCGASYSRGSRTLQLSIANLIMGATTMVCTFLPSVFGYFAIKTLQYLAIGYHDILCHTLMLNLWGSRKTKSVVYSILLVMNPLGALIVPLIISVFLFEIPEGHNFKQNDITQNLTSVNISNSNIILFDNETHQLGSTQTHASQIDNVKYSFVIVGGFAIILSIAFMILHCKIGTSAEIKERAQATKNQPNQKQLTLLPMVLFMCLVAFCASFIVIQSWISPFVVTYLDWDSHHGSYIASAFWMGMLVGRMTGVVLPICMSQGAIIFMHLLLTIISVLCTSIASLYQQHLLWILIPLVGFAGMCLIIYLFLSNVTIIIDICFIFALILNHYIYKLHTC